MRCFVMAALVSFLASCEHRPATATSQDASAPAPETGTVTVTVEPDGTGVARELLDAILGAKAAVHVEMYLLSSDTYLAALESLSAKGVDVRVVLNRSFPSGTSASDTNERAYDILSAAGVPVRWAPTTTGFDGYTHSKTVIIDPEGADAEAWIMTMNLDPAGLSGNREYLARDTLPGDIAEAESIFEADYEATELTPEGSLVIAPSPENDAVEALLSLIDGATATIDLETEELDDAGIESMVFAALAEKARAGVVVRLVIEDSTDKEQLAAILALEDAGGAVAGYPYEPGVTLDIHGKALVVDGKAAFVGSENFSGGSLGYNREIGVIVTEPREVAKIESAIAGDFEAGSAYSPE